MDEDRIIQALYRLYEGLARKAPGSDALTRSLLDRLALPPRPAAADFGCGSGHAAILLAERLGAEVQALDLSPVFIAELEERLAREPLSAGSVRAAVGDMLTPAIAPGSLDLVWSEGAAYAVGIERALAAWKPLLRPGGFAVLSECCWFRPDPAPATASFWAENYPAIGTAGAVIGTAERLGFSLVHAERLPESAWWDNYYDPLASRLDGLAGGHDPALAEAVAATRREMALYREHAADYGYVFFMLQAY